VSRQQRRAEARRQAAQKPFTEYFVIVHTNPKCRAPLEPCRCKYATTRPLATQPEIDAGIALRGARLARLTGGMS
jgi:hypothetical protein